MKKLVNKKLVSIALLFSMLALTLVACSGDDGGDGGGSKGKITFADAGWESNQFHNAVAGIIAEEVFDYTWEETPGSTAVMHEGLLSGEIDIHMEEWTDNIPQYQPDLDDGKLQELSVNFDDNYQGIYVPRYVIEGDEEKGIEASAPDLKYVWDLKDYPDIFPDDEEEGMGRIYGAISGWEVDDILERKYKHYDLDENFVYFSPGSDTALQTAIIDAYDKGEPIAAYYWEPTALLGQYDMVLLEDEPYEDDEKFKAGETELPAMRVTIAVSNDFNDEDENADFIEFLSNYETSSELTSEGLALSEENNGDFVEGAKQFLREHDELLDEWLNEEDANTMREALGD
ncbi:MAG TPA: ABC transporter substrate-binding protein [Tissierellaceae bacterium]|nr:ABC transporter substrate-binding protein [Tissierellaceae bacterium]